RCQEKERPGTGTSRSPGLVRETPGGPAAGPDHRGPGKAAAGAAPWGAGADDPRSAPDARCGKTLSRCPGERPQSDGEPASRAAQLAVADGAGVQVAHPAAAPAGTDPHRSGQVGQEDLA